MDYYSAIKWNEMMPFAATWIDQEIIILSEVSHTVKGKYMISLWTCGIKKKKIQNNLFTNRNRLTDIESKLMATKGERGR